ETLAGRRPFDAASRDVVAAQILTGRAPSLRDYAPELSDAMTRVIMRALEPDRKARFPTMRAMHEAFAAAMAATPHWPRWPVFLAIALIAIAGVTLGVRALHVAGDCSAIYVSSAKGDDANNGCSTAPKRTITAALAAVKNGNREIHVCRGTYAETLEPTGTLRGGYDCKTWRRTSGYGYPTF